MKKLASLLLLFLLLCLSCAPDVKTGGLERKRATGDSTVEVYEYGWKMVYNAMSFVWRHSEDRLISMRYINLDLDFVREEKAILVKIPGYNAMDMGIFFEPQGESKTRVVFVKGGYTGGAWRGMTIRRLTKETHYYLDNGEEAYRKYTHLEHIRQEKEEERALSP